LLLLLKRADLESSGYLRLLTNIPLRSLMDDDHYGHDAKRIRGKSGGNDSDSQATNIPSPSSNVTLPFHNSALSLPPDFHNAGSRAALLAGGAESQRDRLLNLNHFPAAQSIAESMPTLEEQLASLIKEQQRRTLPLTIEQQVASFIEEQQGRNNLIQRSRSIPLDRAFSTDHMQASWTGQPQGRRQSLQATNSVADRMPTIEQLLVSLNGGRGSFHATTSDEENRSTILASLLNEQQGRSSDCQDRKIPSVEQLLSSLNDEHQRKNGSFQAANSIPNSTSTLEQQLAFLLERQHQGDRRSSQDMMPTIDQQSYHGSSQDRLPSIEQQVDRGSSHDMMTSIEQLRYRGLSQDRIPTIEQQGYRASSQDRIPTIEQQGYRASSQDRIPTIEQQLASLIQAADFASPSSFLTSNFRTEHQPSLPSAPEHLSLYGQLQRDFAPLQRDFTPQAQPEIQTQAGGCNTGTADEGQRVDPLPAGVPKGMLVAMPPPYGSQETFPGKLYCLLIEAEREGNDHIISFTPDGSAFKINNRDAFIEVESPKHFRHTHITSFVRQLNFYGFKRQPKGPNRGGFAHPFFLRGHPELLVKIEKKDVKQRPTKGR
jgi:hypothetical protein